MLTAIANAAKRVIRLPARTNPVFRQADPLDHPLLYLSQYPDDALTIRDAFAGLFACGATGSGKTSGFGATVARQLLRNGFGGLVLTVKVDECEQWERYAWECGRARDLIIVRPGSPWKLNFMRYEANRAGRGGGLTENIVRLFITLLEAGEAGESKASERFWDRAVKALLRNAVDSILLGSEPLHIANILRLIASAPLSPQQLQDPQWQARSCVLQCLEKAHQRKDLTPVQRQNLEMCKQFFLQDWPYQSENTRANIAVTFSVMADLFCRGDLYEMFSTDLTVVPEHAFAGKIIIIDMPIKAYGEVGRLAQTVWKFLFQQACERRNLRQYPRPQFLWLDECQELLNSHDFLYLSTARSSRVASVYMTQSISAVHAKLSGGGQPKALADAILANFATKFILAQADPESARWAEELFAKDWTQHTSRNVSQSRQQDPKTGRVTMHPQISTNISHSLDSRVLAGWTLQLKTGGPANRCLVEALVYGAGRTWRATGSNWLKTAFQQR